MQKNTELYNFDKQIFDIWHFKITDKMVNKDDYEKMEWFSENINAPFKMYDEHLQAINFEERVHMIFIIDNMDEYIELETRKDDIYWQKLYLGYYEDLKPEIEQYVLENNLGHMRREVEIKDPSKERVMFSGATIKFYDYTNSLGFYYKREGLLRFNTKSGFVNLDNDNQIFGKLSDLKKLKKNLEIDYYELVYGKEGREQFENYFQTHFVDTFEYGKSFICLS